MMDPRDSLRRGTALVPNTVSSVADSVNKLPVLRKRREINEEDMAVTAIDKYQMVVKV